MKKLKAEFYAQKYFKIKTILSSIILLPILVGAEIYTTNKGADITTNEGPLIYGRGESEYKNISAE